MATIQVKSHSRGGKRVKAHSRKLGGARTIGSIPKKRGSTGKVTMSPAAARLRRKKLGLPEKPGGIFHEKHVGKALAVGLAGGGLLVGGPAGAGLALGGLGVATAVRRRRAARRARLRQRGL
jgi:hypothetical protein